MKQTILEQMKEMDNNSLNEMALLCGKLVAKRNTDILDIMSEKNINLDKFDKIFKHLKNYEINHQLKDFLCNKKYTKDDINFLKVILEKDNNSITQFTKQNIFRQAVFCSVLEPSFLNTLISKIDPVFTNSENIHDIISTKINSDGLNDVDINIFDELAEKHGLQITSYNIDKYLRDENLAVLKHVCKSPKYRKFFEEKGNIFKAIAKSLDNNNYKVVDFLTSHFNSNRATKRFFKESKHIEHLCKTSNLDFFTYVMDNFDCKGDSYFLSNTLYYLRESTRICEEKILIAMHSLVRNNYTDKDFINQLEDAILSKKHNGNEDKNKIFSDIAIKIFNLVCLENALVEKDLKQVKIKI